MEELKARVEEAKKEAGTAYQKYSLLKDVYLKAEKEYFEKSRAFQALDYKLALEDGRLKKVPPSASGLRKTKKPELTLDQLRAIAEKLGFDLSEIDKDEKAEEIEEVDDEEEI